MFKRANKITSLLVAAASIMSLVPAYASDVKKIDSEDGVIYGAVAYKDGAALIDGEIDDNDGAYYYSDGKYTELDDVDSGSDYEAYGTKYANVDDGDYFVDLENGTVTDDDLDEDDEDDAASQLRKEIKDSDRYADSTNVDGYAGDTDIADLTLLPGNKFADSWYSAKYILDVSGTTDVADGTYATTTAAGAALSVTSGTGTDYYTNIFTDSKGNYIDADYNLGKIKVETTSGSATIENSIDLEDLNGTKDAGAKITDSKVLGQDKDYIYRYAKITVTLTGGKNYGKVTINNKDFAVTASGNDGTVVLPVIQKISKAQDSDDIDDGKYAKTVYNYVISDDDENSSTDVMDAGAASSGDAKNYYDLAIDTDTKATVIGGKLVLYKVTNSDSDENVVVQAATLKTKNGYYYTDLEEKTTVDADYSNDTENTAFDTDVDGNIFVLEDGYVKKFDGTDDWDKVYKVDGSMDALSVYDKDNMVTWSQDDEVYSLIGSKAAADDTTTPVTATGWVQAADGTWSYVNTDGTKATGWLNDKGTWYYLKSDGVMATGWLNDNGTWYYLNASGAMQTGWLNDNGTWYYLSTSGAMLSNTTVDGYVLGSSGAWIK